jgi:hypothetical protein
MQFEDASQAVAEGTGVAFFTPRVQTTPSRLTEDIRLGRVKYPQANMGPYPSSILARPVRINFPKEASPQPSIQLNLPSDIVPSTTAAARVRTTPADVASQQLEAYMSKLQRGRTTPLTSQVRIQPTLF